MSLREQYEQQRARSRSRLWAADAGGRSGLALQMGGIRQRGVQQSTVTVGQTPAAGGAPGAELGETVTVSKASQEIAAAGTAISWAVVEDVPARGGFANVPDALPVTELVTNVPGGYYDLTLEFAWDTYTGGGTVTVEVDDVVVATVTATSGDRFARTIPLGVCL